MQERNAPGPWLRSWRQTAGVDLLIAIGLFVAGAALAIWATDRLLEGLVGLAALTTLSAFAIGALLSGLEAENIAVGLAGGARGADAIALGSVFGGAIFLVTVALGLGAIIAPLEVRLPRAFLGLIAAAPVLAGVALVGDRTSPVAGVVLLGAFAIAMAYVVRRSRHRTFLLSGEVAEAQSERRSVAGVIAITLLGLVGLTIGGNLVAEGAGRLVTLLGVPALLVGMVFAPAAIEIEEVFRQAIPARRGRPEVSAANLLGTLLYFVLFNLGLIALLTPVRVDPQVRLIDWPVLMVVTWLAVLFLARGRVGRIEGLLLLVAYAGYVALRALA